MQQKTVNMDMPKITATENQRKVIKDKYLRDAPSLEAWLMGVAHNIALAEIVHSLPEEKVFKDVSYEKRAFDNRGQTTYEYFLHAKAKDIDEQKENFRRFMQNLNELAANDPQAKKIVEKTQREFYALMSTWKFLPNSPTLMNAGRDLQQLSACYVLPVEDSLEGIYDSVKSMAIIHQSGGGTGFDFSHLRPSGSRVQSTLGVASGPLTFMQLFDKSTDVVKQGGTRRGANMGILRYDHPDIDKFIEMKKTPGVMENFNVSVTITEDFMDKVGKGEDYDLIDPHTNKVVGTRNAKKMWDRLVHGAWETGDPGIIFIDRINNSRSNPTPAQGMIESTNPCGEQPLLPFEPCNLGSINLSKFVSGDDMDWTALKQTVRTCVHFLDNVVTVNNYPLFQIERIAKSNRRIGLGVMGWAETLVRLGLPYGGPESLEKAKEVMRVINEEAMAASEALAKERGAFGGWKDSIFDKQGDYYRGEDHTPRNSARTTIAPTGTIGIAAGLQGAGIEPFFAIVYTRYNAKALDALKKGETPNPNDTFWEVNPLFEKIAAENDYFGLGKEELWKRIDANHKSVTGMKEIPEKVQALFKTSHDLTPLDHVRMQCAFQEYTDNAVSKTVNLKNEAKPKDIEEVYMLAFKLGAKGVTVYRDGSKSFQVLNLGDKKAKAEKKPKKIDRDTLQEKSDYYQIETGSGTLHMHINYDELGPRRIFGNLSPLGTEISGLTSALCIMISKYLEAGGDPVRILKHLNSIKSDRPYGFGAKRVDSVPHAISKALRQNLVKTGFFADQSGQTSLTGKKLDVGDTVEEVVKAESVSDRLHCSKCFSTNVQMMAGCSEPTCFDCGYSKCS